MFEDSTEVNISGRNPILNYASRDITIIYQSLGPKRGFELLLEHVETESHHNSRDVSDAPKCRPGTRIAIRDMIFHWASASVYIIRIQWIYGTAGCGKSPLLRTLAEELKQHGLLLASFFFCGIRDRRNNADYFIPTIAYQIARSIPTTRLHIERAIENDPFIFNQSLDAQAEALIVLPITQAYQEGGISKEYPRIIIVDGIDECKGERKQQQVLRVLNKVLMVPIPLAFLIASRPETHIVATFDSDLSESCTRLALENFDEADKADKEDRITPDDVVIGVLGPTGSGKSTFISRVSERTTGVGHSLRSCTTEVKMVRFSSPALTDSKIVLLDTPGFDHTDADISTMVSDWLSKVCKEKISLAGLLYFHPISARRVTGPALLKLNMVQELRRKGMLENVVLVTTMWDKVEDEWGATREDQLVQHYWKGLTIRDPKTYRYLRDARSAFRILEPLAEAANARNAKVLKSELADIDKFRQALAVKTCSQKTPSFSRAPVYHAGSPRLGSGWEEVTLDAGRGLSGDRLAEIVGGVDDGGGGGSGIRLKGAEKQQMRIQKEISRYDLELQAALAGQALYTQLGSLVALREDILKRMKEQLSWVDQNGDVDQENALLNELEDLKESLKDTLEEIEKLRLPLGDRLKKVISETISMKQFAG